MPNDNLCIDIFSWRSVILAVRYHPFCEAPSGLGGSDLWQQPEKRCRRGAQPQTVTLPTRHMGRKTPHESGNAALMIRATAKVAPCAVRVGTERPIDAFLLPFDFSNGQGNGQPLVGCGGTVVTNHRDFCSNSTCSRADGWATRARQHPGPAFHFKAVFGPGPRGWELRALQPW
jgi:hypothetical protein